MPHNLPEVIITLFIGASILVSVLAIGVRIGFKPILESWFRIRQGAAAEDAKILQDRRISILEAELQAVQSSLEKLVDAEEFRRQLEESRRGLEALPRKTEQTKAIRGA